jgi:DNA-binding LacI/PurR family transcriptional regulator
VNDAGDPEKPAGPARIKDVAARANVSLKTVTNVVHGRRYVSDDTRSRVLAAIDELGYRPSIAGRMLQKGRSDVIALAVPRIDEPYLGALAHAVIASAASCGYTVLIDETGSGTEGESQAVLGYPGHGIDGVIFSPFAHDPARLASSSRFTPMVLLAEQLPDSTADYVSIDNDVSAREVVRHLVETGRRRIAFLGDQPDQPTGIGHLRALGYRAQMDESGLSPGWLLPAESFTRENGAAIAKSIVAGHKRPDAIVCASDLLAIGVMRALAEHGVRVPEEVAVTGWDNTIDGEYQTPTLTTVATDLTELADKVLAALISRIRGDRSPPQTHTVSHRLVVRESTAPSRHSGPVASPESKLAADPSQSDGSPPRGDHR